MNKATNAEKWRYIERWTIYSILIGAIAGLGAFAFYLLLKLAEAFFLGYFAGYRPASPAGESSFFSFPSILFNYPWMLALIPAIGGLIAGFISYFFAPEAGGEGTDAVIDSFHNKKSEIRRRVPLVKAIASAITIGSGGSAGREGPIMQIGGGFGSFLASHAKLSERDRRGMMICGAGAGLGAIFKTPLGGALFSIEVLYRRDFEMEAMVPAIVSSVVSYAVFCSFPRIGWNPIFETPHYVFIHPYELLFYAILGIACAALGIFYVRIFYGTRNLFRRFKILNYIKPAIGGAMLGFLLFFISYFAPRALDGILGMGYGAVQNALDGKLTIFILLIIAILKIFSTSFTVGSGGSGGVLAPSLVIGAMLGGFFGEVFHFLFPALITQPSVFVLIGMAAFFGGVAKAPVASILMVSEMTGSYSLLVPLMLSVTVAYVLTGKHGIYEKQAKIRKESPAHRKEFMIDIFEGIKVEEAYVRDVLTIQSDMNVEEAAYFAEKMGHVGYPVVKDNNKLIGCITAMNLEEEIRAGRKDKKVGEVCSKPVIGAYTDEFLEDVLHKMSTYKIGRLPVVKREGREKEEKEEEVEGKEVIGIITRSDIIRIHERYHETQMRK